MEEETKSLEEIARENAETGVAFAIGGAFTLAGAPWLHSFWKSQINITEKLIQTSNNNIKCYTGEIERFGALKNKTTNDKTTCINYTNLMQSEMTYVSNLKHEQSHYADSGMASVIFGALCSAVCIGNAIKRFSKAYEIRKKI